MPRFQPGQSGNLRGRPRVGTSLAERIREKGGDDGAVYVDLLHDIATNPKETTKLRIEAVRLLMQRGFGAIPTEVSVEEPLVINADQIRRLLEQEHLLGAPAESASAEPEEAEEDRVHAWITGGG